MPSTSRIASFLTAGWLSLGVPGAAGAASADEPAVPEAANAPPKIELQRLLTLPDDLEYSVERRGGATRKEWQTRFQEARADRVAAKAALDRAQTELEGVAQKSDNWQIAPPGTTADVSQAPLNYRLRQEINRQRSEVERAEKRLRELEIEGNLAGVPDDWRR